MKTFFHSIAVLICAAVMSPLFAVESSGLRVEVFKRTVGKTDVKTEYASGKEQSINLVVSIKNVSLRNMPEGELRWALLVKKGYSHLTDKESGVETVKALKVSETTEITLGPVKVGEYHSGGGSSSNYKEYKDKLDYQIIIMQDDQEKFRLGSDSDFAKSTRPIEMAKPEVALVAPNSGQTKLIKEDFGNGEAGKPKPVATEVKPAERKPLIGKEDPPPAGKTPTPVVANTPPPQTGAEYSAAKPFDFFNLGGNGK